MKLIPEQVQLLMNKLEAVKLELRSYDDYFSNLKYGDSESMAGDGSNNLINSQYQLTERQKREYESVLRQGQRITEIDTTKIGLGTKFSLQFKGEDKSEQYTLVDTKIGMACDSCISLETPIGKALESATIGDEVSYSIPGTQQKNSATVTDIVRDTSQYINYLPHRSLPENLCLTDSQAELLEQEKEFVKKDLSREKYEMREIVPGTKIIFQMGNNTPREYTVVDKMEYEIDKDREISLHNKLIENLAAGTGKNSFPIYVAESEIKNREYGKILGINQENIFSYEEKKKRLNTLTTRINEINYLLAAVPRINPEINEDRIGIGSHVSMVCKETGERKRVEIIQRAVSYELDANYLEIDSPIGSQIMGLSGDNSIQVQNGEITYTVSIFDIDNKKGASRVSDPILYQKLKK